MPTGGRSIALRGAATALAAAFALAPVACTDDKSAGTGTGENARKGGSITVAQVTGPDHLDPALGATAAAWEPLWIVYTPLLTYRHAEGKAGAELIPGLAEELPEISSDGLTYRLTLRTGLRYSDGRRVRAADFEHTVKRVLALESAGARLFRGIVGARRFERSGSGDLAGIEADERTRVITIGLERPDPQFSNVLATTYAGLVSSRTPVRDLTTRPPAGVGPYRITASRPGRGFSLEQVRGFELPGIPAGNVEQINARVGGTHERQARAVIGNTLDYMQSPPPDGLLAEIRSAHEDRFIEYSTTSVHLFSFNLGRAPFDNPQVRRAVNFAVDSEELGRIYAGRLQPMCNVLPGAIPGHERIDPCPFGDPRVSGDPERARQIVEDAGAGGEKVRVYAPRSERGRAVGRYYRALLNKIGLDARLTLGPAPRGAQTEVRMLVADFPHPANVIGRFAGIDGVIDAELAELALEPDLDSVEGRWAALDRRLVERSYVAPYGSEKLATFTSERMDLDNCSVFHPAYHNDYSSFCLK